MQDNYVSLADYENENDETDKGHDGNNDIKVAIMKYLFKPRTELKSVLQHRGAKKWSSVVGQWCTGVGDSVTLYDIAPGCISKETPTCHIVTYGFILLR